MADRLHDAPGRPRTTGDGTAELSRAVELYDVYSQAHDLAVLREAIALLRTAAAAATTSLDHADRLNRLGIALQMLFARTSELPPLREAVEAGRAAVAAVPADHPGRATCLAHLGEALRLLFEQDGSLATIQEAVQVGGAAFDATPDGHPGQAGRLSSVGTALIRLFEKTGDPAALDQAVKIHRTVAAAIPAGAPGRARCLANLGVTLRQSFDRVGDLALLDESIQAVRDAVTAVPADHPAQARYRHDLACALRARFERAADPALLTEIEQALGPAATSPVAPIVIRMAAGGALAKTRVATRSPDEVLSTLEAAIDLLPQLASRTWSRTDRERGVGQLGPAGLAAESAALAVAVGRPDRALEFLEQARGQQLRGVVGDRSDLTELHDVLPALADELDELRQQSTMLETAETEATGPDGTGQTPVHVGEQRRRLTELWAESLGRIRAVAGFEQFLRPPGIDRLRRQAADGPIVTVYAVAGGGAALILTTDADHPVRVVPLPALTSEAVTAQVVRLRAALDATDRVFGDRARPERALYGILAWLWDNVAAPVLDDLGLTEAASAPPRIWWCPVGALASLPLHAAGRHLEPGQRTVLDRTISSYIPSIRALEQARDRRPTAPGPALVVAMPITPDAPDLAGTAREARELTRLLANPRLLLGPDATYSVVTEALAQHAIAHFACHGWSDHRDPAASRLLLHDHTKAPLTVAALARLRLADAELAYLSACGTTATSAAPADEAVHLTAAIHLAGYRHVVGTLWPIDDAIAVQLAADFYTHLTGDGAYAPRTDDCAIALTMATRNLRDEYPAAPTRWAAHIHQGA